jgi:hypothetical protein
MDKFLDTYDLLILNQEDINNMNISIMSNEIKTVIQNLPIKKSPGLDGFTAECYRSLKKSYH